MTEQEELEAIYKAASSQKASGTFAKKGEIVTCSNGHPICEVAQDIINDSEQNPDRDYVNWTQDPPTIGTSADKCRCAVCGARFYYSGVVLEVIEDDSKIIKTVSGAGLHFADGWR